MIDSLGFSKNDYKRIKIKWENGNHMIKCSFILIILSFSLSLQCISIHRLLPSKAKTIFCVYLRFITILFSLDESEEDRLDQ